MSELKVASCFEFEKVLSGKSNKLFYSKSEVDEVIAALKKERDWLAKDRAQAYDDLEKRAQLNIKQEESIRRHKYKRCKAKAEACMHKRWRTDEGFDYARSTRHMNKWLELAEKVKEAK